MVIKRLCLAALFGLASFAGASESGVLSYRAHTSLEAGKFAKAYGQLERALLASRREADLHAEARVLMAMSHIRTMSQDFDLADSLLSVVRKDILDDQSKIMLTQNKIALLNAREDFKNAAKLCDDINEKSLKKLDDPLQASVYSECAIAKAGTKNSSGAEEALKLVGKRTDKKGGFYAYTAARIADLSGKSDADSLYKIAEEKSIQGNKPYMTSTILYLRSQLKGAKDAADMKLRCKNAFELMGLPNNAKRCEK